MDLIYEISQAGHGCDLLPASDVPAAELPAEFARAEAPNLPSVSEVALDRHYQELAEQVFGVCNGFYPLGSCTMKYNPRINERAASLPGFANLHPLQPESSAQGALELMFELGHDLEQITGMDAVTLQPAAGAHGEFTGLLLIRNYHLDRGDAERTKIIVPDSAHGTNPASASMVGYDVVNVASAESGAVDLDALREAVGPDTAGLMLTNPNTLGLFDPNIEEICQIVHDAGGLCYYDGANLNPIMGIARPGDMGFDCVHLNLHKTFSTPHGGGGPGAGPVGCKAFLADYLPGPIVEQDGEAYAFKTPDKSMGRVKAFYGNFAVCVRAFAYLSTLGKEGLSETAQAAVLNANYLKVKLCDLYATPYDGPCMHEFVIDAEPLKEKTGVSAMDIAKRLLDFGMHPPTMYFPLIVHEALMLEPTETESRETLDHVIEVFRSIFEEASADPDNLHSAPHLAAIGRPDEVAAARDPKIRYVSDEA